MDFVKSHFRKMQLKVPFCEKKVFNYSELHFSEITSYKIHTLRSQNFFLETKLCGDLKSRKILITESNSSLTLWQLWHNLQRNACLQHLSWSKLSDCIEENCFWSRFCQAVPQCSGGIRKILNLCEVFLM